MAVTIQKTHDRYRCVNPVHNEKKNIKNGLLDFAPTGNVFKLKLTPNMAKKVKCPECNSTEYIQVI